MAREGDVSANGVQRRDCLGDPYLHLLPETLNDWLGTRRVFRKRDRGTFNGPDERVIDRPRTETLSDILKVRVLRGAREIACFS